MVLSTKRLAVLVVGMGVIAVGIVMIPAPGPGWLVVFAGLALLATEFTWAEILLDRAKRQATRARDLAVRSVRSRRRSTSAPLEIRVTQPSSNGDTDHDGAVSPELTKTATPRDQTDDGADDGTDVDHGAARRSESRG